MIQVFDGSTNQTISDKETKVINGLEFVGNGYGKEDSIDKGLPTWNEKNIKNFLYLFSLIAQKTNISDIVDNLTSTDTNKPLSAKQGKTLFDLLSSVYTKTETDTRIDTKIASLVGAAPESLNTLKEIADALADDDNQIAALVNSIALKLSISDIVDNLTSTDTNKPLSAKQGKILNDLISSLYTKSQIDSLLSASGISPSHSCSVFSTENMNFTRGSSSFKVVSENALSWVVQLTLDVEFSSVSDYSSGIVFSYDPSLLPNSSYSECVRTDSLACVRGGNIPMSCYCNPMSSYGSGNFKVVFGVNPNSDYHICGDVTILVFK